MNDSVEECLYQLYQIITEPIILTKHEELSDN